MCPSRLQTAQAAPQTTPQPCLCTSLLSYDLRRSANSYYSHLLGKKSWNVYNQDNIDRVRRDEAAARAKEEAEEQRMQEIDAERRMQILRGEVPADLPEIENKEHDEGQGGPGGHTYGPGRERRKRKRVGEDDTDFEMRIAQAQTSSSDSKKQITLHKSTDAPLVDHAGHIDLFPQDRASKPAKNSEAEKEAAQKKKEYEDQFTMRFSNAAGFKQGLENPWYSKSSATVSAVEEDAPSKNVWGNEDPRRKERDAARMVSSDPLAAMRQGAAQVRQVERERKRWREEKERELRALREEEKRKRRHKRRHHDDPDDLEGFMLDAPSSSRKKEDDRDRERRHRHRESSRRSHRDEGGSHRHGHQRHRD